MPSSGAIVSGARRRLMHNISPRLIELYFVDCRVNRFLILAAVVVVMMMVMVTVMYNHNHLRLRRIR